MPPRSAGILLYRRRDGKLELLLAHPGGPYWRNRDEGAWTLPKGEIRQGEGPLEAARREFAEELGVEAGGAALPLGEVRQRGGKRVSAWAVAGDLDPEGIRSNTFTLEWPPRSGRCREFPEIDRVAWFSPLRAREKIKPAQRAFVDRLVGRLDPDG